jgi:hypothetical protein
VVLVVTFVAPGAPAIVITALVVCAFAGLWFALPLSRRDRDDRQDGEGRAGDGEPRGPAGQDQPARPTL